MELNVTFKEIESTEAIKEYAAKKVEKFEKYVTYPMTVHLILSVHKEQHSAEIVVHAEHRELVALAKSEDLYGSIDAVVHKIENQLKKEREKRKGHAAAHKAARAKEGDLPPEIAAELPHQGKKAIR
jgi:putative sigma-54 modulation protein